MIPYKAMFLQNNLCGMTPIPTWKPVYVNRTLPANYNYNYNISELIERTYISLKNCGYIVLSHLKVGKVKDER